MASRVSVYGIGALRAPYGILRSRHLRRLDSIHPSRDDSMPPIGGFHPMLRIDSMRHFVSIPCARTASDSIHAFGVMKRGHVA